MTDSTRVLVALVAGLAGGAAIAASGNPALLAAADWLTPIGTIWVNAIRMTVIPLVVSLVITGRGRRHRSQDHRPARHPHAAHVHRDERRARRGDDAAHHVHLLADAGAGGPSAAAGRGRRGGQPGGVERRGGRPGAVAGVAAPGQPDRRRRERQHGVADPVHAAAGGGDRQERAGLARDAAGVLPGARRRDAGAGRLGRRRGADRDLRPDAAARRARRSRGGRSGRDLHRDLFGRPASSACCWSIPRWPCSAGSRSRPSPGRRCPRS